MNAKKQIDIETAILKARNLSLIMDSARALAAACHANNLTPDELAPIVISLAKKELA